jgi:hypothetical protein
MLLSVAVTIGVDEVVGRVDEVVGRVNEVVGQVDEVVGLDGSGSVFGPADVTAGAVADVAGPTVLALVEGECAADAPAAIAGTAPSAEASRALLKSV